MSTRSEVTEHAETIPRSWSSRSRRAWLLGALLFCTTSEAQDAIFASGWESGEQAPQDQELCSSVPEAVALGVRAPIPPQYSNVPVGACHVDSTVALQQSVDDPACADISLEPGVYGPEGLTFPYLALKRTTRLWSAHPGAATLTFGISLGGNLNNPADFAGSELHGLTIDIADAANAVPFPTAQFAAILFWGKASDVVIQDVIIRGHGVLHRGISAAQPNGLRINRVQVEGFRRFGVILPWVAPERPALVENIVVRNVGDPEWRATPEWQPGTQEHGVWIGFPAVVSRVRVRDAYWSGLITGGYAANNPQMMVTDVLLEDVDIDRIGDDVPQNAGAGIAFERITHDLTLQRFCVGPATQRGVHAEWNHYDPVQSARRLDIGHGVVSSAYAGVYFDYGTSDSFVHDLQILRARWSGIGMYYNYVEQECVPGPGQTVSPAICNSTRWENVSFGPSMAAEACPLTLSHYLTSPAVCLQE